jgi:tetratricopeptide (TPR) repeat protein
MAALLGCAVPESNTGTGSPISGSGAATGAVYQPTLQPGRTYPVAKKELGEVLSGREGQIGIKYYGRPEVNDLARVDELIELMKGAKGVARYYDSNRQLDYFLLASIPVLEDRIEVSTRLALFYADLLDRPIHVSKSRGSSGCPYMVHLGLFSFHFKDLTHAQKFADSLYSIQQLQIKADKERLARFESAAAQYRSLKVKPPVSEEQRKLIVQANAMGQRKEYARAIDLYLKAVDMDPISYPAAYFNLALLSAQLNWFKSAISYMKQYLLLDPEAKDARGAQDKIYEWEYMLR